MGLDEMAYGESMGGEKKRREKRGDLKAWHVPTFRGQLEALLRC